MRALVSDTLDGGAAALERWELHYRLLEPLAAYLGVATWHTIGCIERVGAASLDDEAVEGELYTLLSTTRVDPDCSNLQCWLTLPSLEIVDASSPDHLFAGHPGSLVGVRYRPLLVGVDFLWRIGAIGALGRSRGAALTS